MSSRFQILTNREALAALADGAAAYRVGEFALSRISIEIARAFCRRSLPHCEDSPFAANADGDLFYLGRAGDTISCNFKRLCSLVDA